MALIKHPDGTETAVFTISEYNEYFINYYSYENSPNYAKGISKMMRKLFDIQETDKNWQKLNIRNDLLKSRFDKNSIIFLKAYFQDIKNIAETKNYKLDHFSGYLLLYMEEDVSTSRGVAKVSGHMDSFLAYYTNTFIAAPGQIRPDIVVANQYLISKYRDMMKKYQDDAFGSIHQMGWSDNKKVALLTRAAIINTYRQAILLQQNPENIIYKIKGHDVSLKEIYDASIPVLEDFYKTRGNTHSLNSDQFKVVLKNSEIPLSDLISDFSGIPIDKNGNVQLSALKDKSNNLIPTDNLSEKHYEYALIEVNGFIEPAKNIVRRIISDDLTSFCTNKADSGSASLSHARFLSEYIGISRGHHIVLEALKLYPQLRGSNELNPRIVDALQKHFFTDAKYYALLSKINENIKRAEKSGNPNINALKTLKSIVEEQLSFNKLKKRAGGRNIDNVYHRFSIFSLYSSIRENIGNLKKDLKNGIEQNYVISIVAPIIFTAVFDFMLELYEKNSESFAKLVTDNQSMIIIGATLSIVVLSIFNGLDNKLNFGTQHVKFDYHTISPNPAEQQTKTLLSLLNPWVLSGTMISAVGMFLRMFGAPFYQGKELVLKIGELIGDHLNENAEIIWNSIAGYELPLVEQTVFETAVNLALGGWEDTLMGILVSLISNTLNSMLSSFVKPIVANLTFDVFMNSDFF